MEDYKKFTGRAALLMVGWANTNGSVEERDALFPDLIRYGDEFPADDVMTMENGNVSVMTRGIVSENSPYTALEKLAIVGKYCVYMLMPPTALKDVVDNEDVAFVIYSISATDNPAERHINSITSWMGESAIFRTLQEALNVVLDMNIRDFSLDLKERLFSP